MSAPKTDRGGRALADPTGAKTAALDAALTAIEDGDTTAAVAAYAHDLRAAGCGATDAELWAEYLGVRADDAEIETAAVAAIRAAYAPGRNDVTVTSARRTDAGNAARLVKLHGAQLRHAHGLGWLVWDGRRWQQDTADQVMQRAKLTADAIVRAGVDTRDQDEGQLMKWGWASESAARLDAMVKLARSDETIVIEPTRLDADPFVLNVQNGTIDLRTGTLRPHTPSDLLTKMAGASYDPTAQCPRFLAFLREVFAGDDELIAFIQRAVGYTLTGDTSEQRLFVLHGPGLNGKSTLLETIALTLGDHAASADPASFTTAASSRSVRSDLARLRGARMVRAAELDRDAHLAEALVKQLTGGEPITAAYKHRDEFEYHPTLKLWLALNDLPAIGSDGPAIWRRISVVPFAVSIHQPDRQLPATLRAELPGVLAWAVRGCLQWQADGLGTCAAVRSATAAYRGHQDRVSAFIDARCHVDPHARTDNTQLRAAYVEWEEDHGRAPLTERDFFDRLTRAGHTAQKSNGRRYRTGLALLTGPDRDTQTHTPYKGSSEKFGNDRPCAALTAVEGGRR